MEINELKYFLYVAKIENINKAAEHNSISPGSLSKAISKLELELDISLFNRIGRNIKLSEAGKTLQKRAASILGEIEDIKLTVGGSTNELKVDLCGEELLLARFGIEFIDGVKGKFPNSKFNLMSENEKTSLQKLRSREANIIFTTTKPPKEFASKVISDVHFQTCINKKHLLYKDYRRTKQVDVNELIKFPFVLPTQNLLGRTKEVQSSDGWRDDKFPRIIGYKASSIKILESLLLSGKAIAYIPDYLASELDVEVLNVIGCPYYCSQKVYQVTRDPKEFGWLNSVW